MKKITLTLCISLAAFTAFAQKKTATNTKAPVKKQTAPVKIAAIPLHSNLDSASYAFGLLMGTNLSSGGLNSVNYDLLLKGLKDAFNNSKALLSQTQSQTAINNLFAVTSKSKYASTITEGKAFFESNKKVQGVMTTASGLQYQILKPGSGPKPSSTATVSVHYKGTLLDGKQFDSSYDRGEPTSLSVNNVIPGWTEGLQLMQKGAKFKFFIPYPLAYGERAAGPNIPAYSNLIFEIELIDITSN